MSTTAAWFRPASPAGNTRLLMVGAFAGALIVLSLNTVFAWPFGPGKGATAEDAGKVLASAAVGSCITWSAADGSDLRQVDCAEQHLYELTGSADVPSSYGPGAAFPDEKTWQDLMQDLCTPPGRDYLSGKLDPAGRYSIGALKPAEGQWRDGQRTMRCGLQVVGASGRLLPTSGSARRGDQSDVHDPGICLALIEASSGDPKSVGDPIDCAKAHAVEIVGNVDLKVLLGADFPAEDKQRTRLTSECTHLAQVYGGVDPSAKGLTAYGDPRQKDSWDAGSFRVDCKVGALNPDGNALAPVTGSFRGIGTVKSQTANPTGAPQESQPGG